MDMATWWTGAWEEQPLCIVCECSVKTNVSASFSGVVSGPSEKGANVAKINEVTEMNSSAEAIHLTSQRRQPPAFNRMA